MINDALGQKSLSSGILQVLQCDLLPSNVSFGVCFVGYTVL